MLVTVWKNGTYGIRVGKKNARQYFRRNTKSIEVKLDKRFHVFRLTRTFWTTCPEFRGMVIGRWLKSRGLARWLKGHPPKLELISMGKHRFKLKEGQ